MQIEVELRYLEQIRNRRKTVEGRLLRPKYQSLQVGNYIDFHAKDIPNVIRTRVIGLKAYPTFSAMLQEEGIHHCLPDITNLEEAVAIYHSFPDYQKQEALIGVLAIKIEVV